MFLPWAQIVCSWGTIDSTKQKHQPSSLHKEWQDRPSETHQPFDLLVCLDIYRAERASPLPSKGMKKKQAVANKLLSIARWLICGVKSSCALKCPKTRRWRKKGEKIRYRAVVGHLEQISSAWSIDRCRDSKLTDAWSSSTNTSSLWC